MPLGSPLSDGCSPKPWHNTKGYACHDSECCAPNCATIGSNKKACKAAVDRGCAWKSKANMCESTVVDATEEPPTCESYGTAKSECKGAGCRWSKKLDGCFDPVA
jgi:hypothetical protein